MNPFSKVKYPNRMYADQHLSGAAKVIGGAIFAYRNARGVCWKSYHELAHLSNTSKNTVQKAVKELVASGYISEVKTHFFNLHIGKVARGKNQYICNLSIMKEGYTFLPREVFRSDLTITQQVIYIGLYVTAGNRKKAFPSIQEIRKMAGCARSTVCEALKVLKKLPALLVRLCKKRNGEYAHNTYILCEVLSEQKLERPTFQNSGKQEAKMPKQTKLPRPLRWITYFVQKLRSAYSKVSSPIGSSPIFGKLY